MTREIMGNCWIASKVMVLNDMLCHLEEQIEAMEEGPRMEEIDGRVQRDALRKELEEMEREKGRLEECICEALNGTFMVSSFRRQTQSVPAKTARRLKWIAAVRKRNANRTRSARNGTRVPAYVCLRPETTEMDYVSDTSYFSAVSHLDGTDSSASYDVPDGHGHQLWLEDSSLLFGHDQASHNPNIKLCYTNK